MAKLPAEFTIFSGKQVNPTDYRPDIDGLRAVAVIAVVIFHAFPSAIAGGFVGVDVFFVISGYLISKHILAEIYTETFSVKAFYVRRCKRIFPALILVLLASTAFGWLMLTPNEYKMLGRPIAGGAGFAANFVYWHEAGYFDAAADTKPLLHLWSLGIEEQFYIIWPFILTFVWRRAPRHLAWAIVGLALTSLIYSVWLVQHNITADFYSPLSRLWELALGAGLAYFVLLNKPNILSTYRSHLAWLGLFAIIFSIFVIKKGDLFPGAWALLPTVGAAILIFTGGGNAQTSAWVNQRILASRPLVWLGLISYPLYLWHWPLLSFARIILSETPSVAIRLCLIAASVGLAWLSYRFIERPARAVYAERQRRLIYILSIIMLLIFVGGVVIRKFDGLKFRMNGKLGGDVSTLILGEDRGRWQQKCGLTDAQQALFQTCLSDGREPPSFAILGDSKGEALFYGLARESKSGMRGMMIGSVSVPSDVGLSSDKQQLKNHLAFQAVLDTASVKVAILVVALRGHFPVNSETGFIEGDVTHAYSSGLVANFSRAIQKLEQAGKRVIFVIDNPTLPDPTSCISGGMTSSDLLNNVLHRKANPRCTISYTEHLAGTAPYRQFVADLSKANPKLVVYDPTPLLCDVAVNRCSITQNGKFLYSYSDHISDYANSIIARDMQYILE